MVKGTLMPERIQLRRTKGWRKPEGVIVVSRPSRWGNPYRVHRVDNDSDSWAIVEQGIELDYVSTRTEARASAVECFGSDRHNADYPSDDVIRCELAGRDLACWCPLDEPCHADVLLEIANPPVRGEGNPE